MHTDRDAEEIGGVLELEGSGCLCNRVTGKNVCRENVQGLLKEEPVCKRKGELNRKRSSGLGADTAAWGVSRQRRALTRL